ncbi:probable galacturonosyltransferase 4 [Momordica charantia]|uniref:Hexosyltransferase n=1 Tax=Momordica charantia TaxID=3673 RepID=A0A6J1CML1_MOMCH|nr:probable galacturonosyltransferase 4 [Momordica charantia]
MVVRNLVLFMLFVTVIAPILLYTHRLGSFNFSSSRGEFLEDFSSFTLSGHSEHLNILPLESSRTLKEPVGTVYSNNIAHPEHDLSAAGQNSTDVQGSVQDLQLLESREHISARALSTTNENVSSSTENPIRQITDQLGQPNLSKGISVQSGTNSVKERKREQQSMQSTDKVRKARESSKSAKDEDQVAAPNAKVQYLKDQLVQAKLFLSLSATRNSVHFIRQLRQRMKEIQRILGRANKDSELPRDAQEKLKAMDETLTRGKQIQDDCALMVKKVRAMLQSTEEQLRVHRKQALFLSQLTAKTLPKGLHCLPLRLTTEYYSLNYSQQPFPSQEKLEDSSLFHYALFSDNVLAAAVVVNSTIAHARDASKHVFHIVTDQLNYAAMRMWFLVNLPGKATIQVQSIEEFSWLNSSYSPVLKQLGSPSAINYYFKAHRTHSDSNMKFRNPKYLSILNHLRFYLPEIFPKLKKVLFLDDDIVVQKDLTGLWSLDLKGNVNGAVETCGESFHRFDKYLNFSNELISKNFDPRACGWAYGMNVFDLEEWKRQNITDVYHKWQKLNHDRQLWKLGTLPPGLITFWKRTHPLDRSWHVLGLGYNPNINQKEIERAAVIHYNGNMKPWLEIAIPRYRSYWMKYVDFDHEYLRQCNITP